jgi:hypothetical protein
VESGEPAPALPDFTFVLQLAITLQHNSTGIADVKAVVGQGGPALEEIAPGHSTGAVSKPGSGGATRSEIVHVERNGGCRRKAQQ